MSDNALSSQNIKMGSTKNNNHLKPHTPTGGYFDIKNIIAKQLDKETGISKRAKNHKITK